MKKIPTFSFTVFIVLIISLIIVFINSDDTFGQTFIEQIRVADSDDTLDTLSDEQLVSLGKAVCQSSAEWKDENNSLIVINNIVSDYDINTSFIVNLNYFSLFGLNMKYNHRSKARMAELADALDSKSSIFGCGGSTPPPGTFYIQKNSLSRMVT